MPDEQKAGAACQEHAAVAPASPQQLQSHIGAAPQIKQYGFFPYLHTNHLPEESVQKTLKKT
jgi:hypothetical protein